MTKIEKKSKSIEKTVRLQKVIADAGVVSRRKAEDYILAGRIKVNGIKIKELGVKINPLVDLISVDGELINTSQQTEKIYVLFHKPRGCVTTVSDPEGRSTVMDYLKSIPTRIYPVGRLDYYSEGLLILTNDGEIANKIMHPKNLVTKIYEVKVFGIVTDDILKSLRKGIDKGNEKLQASSVRAIKQLPQKTWLEFRLQEGKNREIRKICESCGVTIDKLKRVAIENLTIDDLAPGNYRFLTKSELIRALGWDKSQKISPTKEKQKEKENEKEDKQHKLLPKPMIGPFREGKSSIDVKKITKALKYRPKLRRADDVNYIKFRDKYYSGTMKSRSKLNEKSGPNEGKKPVKATTPQKNLSTKKWVRHKDDKKTPNSNTKTNTRTRTQTKTFSKTIRTFKQPSKFNKQKRG